MGVVTTYATRAVAIKVGHYILKRKGLAVAMGVGATLGAVYYLAKSLGND